MFVQQKVTSFYFLRVIFVLPDDKKMLESSCYIISIAENIASDSTQARSGKDLKRNHTAVKREGTLIYMVDLYLYLFSMHTRPH